MPRNWYLSWLPCITGHLSFGIIGKRLRSSQTYRERREHASKIFINILTVRNLSDSALRGFNGRNRFDWTLTGRDLVFGLMAQTRPYKGDKGGRLVGQICIIDGGNISAKDAFVEAEDVVFKVDFSLRRNGLVAFANSQLGENFTFEHNESKTNGSHNQGHQGLVFQCYAFLKDLTHRHRHHQDDSDSLIDLYSPQRNWRKKIGYNLSRSVIYYVQQDKLESYHNSNGILAYLEAYQNICLEKDRLLTEENIEIIRKSNEAEYGKSVQKIGKRRWFASYVLASVALFFGIIGKFFNFVSTQNEGIINTIKTAIAANKQRQYCAC